MFSNKNDFNASWYLKNNPDVKESGLDPYEHYINHGIHEGRAPSPNGIMTRNKYLWSITLLYSFIKQENFLSLLKKVKSLIINNGLSGLNNKLTETYLKQTGQRDYQAWIDRYDTLTEDKKFKLLDDLKQVINKPLISIIMPVYNPNLGWLKEAVDSILGQIYPNWELCISDDCSTEQSVIDYLQSLPKKDDRIKIVFRKENGNISLASNSAINIASGDFIALMDQDDIIPAHALALVAKAIDNNPNVKLIYSDEDKIDENNVRSNSYFKTDWNLDLFRSQNMFSHLGVLDRDLVNKVGCFRQGFEGSQDYDLVLRCIERIDESQIYHIPHVLYHWRSHSGSTSVEMSVKPNASVAGVLALNQHLERLNINASASYVGHGFRIVYSLPKDEPLVSIIIPTKNAYKLVRKCINSILEKTTYKNYEIIVIDNASEDTKTLNYFEKLKENPIIKVIQDNREFNYSQLNNNAVKYANGELICLLNNDIEVISPKWLNEMTSHALRPEVGAVGAKLWYPNNTLQHGGVLLGIGGLACHAHKGFHKLSDGYFGRMSLISQFSAVTAACMVVKKSIFQEVGGLDEENLKVAFNDVDFCLKIKEMGYRNIWTPYAELYHHESISRGEDDTPEKQKRFNSEVDFMQKKWKGIIAHDPAYSPNITITDTDFSYAFPPRVEW